MVEYLFKDLLREAAKKKREKNLFLMAVPPLLSAFQYGGEHDGALYNPAIFA